MSSSKSPWLRDRAEVTTSLRCLFQKKILRRLFQTPALAFLRCAYSRGREKGTYYGTRDGEQDALAWANRLSRRNPTGAPRPRPYSISTDPLCWGPVCALSLNQE
jgi:hypothetical protein